MYRRGRAGRLHSLSNRKKTRRQAARAQKSRCVGSPGAHCTAHHWRSLPKILTSSRSDCCEWPPTKVRHRRNPPFRPPENTHLNGKSGAQTDSRAAPEKPHRNLPGFKNLNRIRYLRAVDDAAVRHSHSPKTLTFLQRFARTKPCDASRKGSPMVKNSTANRIFSPVLAGFPAISATHRSRKASPLTKFRANSLPENAHL